MSIRFVTGAAFAAAGECSQFPKSPRKPKRKSGHVKPKPYKGSLDQPGRLYVNNLLAMLDISDTEFYRQLNAKKIPAPDGRLRNHPFWYTDTIRQLLESKK